MKACGMICGDEAEGCDVTCRDQREVERALAQLERCRTVPPEGCVGVNCTECPMHPFAEE